jgi:hypothetical protein
LELKPQPFEHSFGTSGFTSAVLNCFVLKTLFSKTKQLRSVLVELLVLNECLNGRGLSGSGYGEQIYVKEMAYTEHIQKVYPNLKFSVTNEAYLSAPFGPNISYFFDLLGVCSKLVL